MDAPKVIYVTECREKHVHRINPIFEQCAIDGNVNLLPEMFLPDIDVVFSALYDYRFMSTSTDRKCPIEIIDNQNESNRYTSTCDLMREITRLKFTVNGFTSAMHNLLDLMNQGNDSDSSICNSFDTKKKSRESVLLKEHVVGIADAINLRIGGEDVCARVYDGCNYALIIQTKYEELKMKYADVAFGEISMKSLEPRIMVDPERPEATIVNTAFLKFGFSDVNEGFFEMPVIVVKDEDIKFPVILGTLAIPKLKGTSIIDLPRKLKYLQFNRSQCGSKFTVPFVPTINDPCTVIDDGIVEMVSNFVN